MTRSRGRMTAPATSAATSAGEARPEASGAIWERLGGMLAPLRISAVYRLCRKKNDFGAIFVPYSAGVGQFQTDFGAIFVRYSAGVGQFQNDFGAITF